MNQPSPGTKPRRRGVVAQFGRFLLENKKWWMAPIILIFLLLMAVVFLSATGVAPVMYTIF